MFLSKNRFFKLIKKINYVKTIKISQYDVVPSGTIYWSGLCIL